MLRLEASPYCWFFLVLRSSFRLFVTQRSIKINLRNKYLNMRALTGKFIVLCDNKAGSSYIHITLNDGYCFVWLGFHYSQLIYLKQTQIQIKIETGTYSQVNPMTKLTYLFIVVDSYDVTSCQAGKVSQCILQPSKTTSQSFQL